MNHNKLTRYQHSLIDLNNYENDLQLFIKTSTLKE
jgi:hypothetical protein